MYLLFKQLFFVQLSFVQRLHIVVIVINFHVLLVHKYICESAHTEALEVPKVLLDSN